MGVEGVGGDHRCGEVEAGKQRLEARDFAGSAVDLALRQHRTGGVVRRGEQVDLAALWGVSGAAQGLAIDRDRPPAPRWGWEWPRVPSAAALSWVGDRGEVAEQVTALGRRQRDGRDGPLRGDGDGR